MLAAKNSLSETEQLLNVAQLKVKEKEEELLKKNKKIESLIKAVNDIEEKVINKQKENQSLN